MERPHELPSESEVVDEYESNSGVDLQGFFNPFNFWNKKKKQKKHKVEPVPTTPSPTTIRPTTIRPTTRAPTTKRAPTTRAPTTGLPYLSNGLPAIINWSTATAPVPIIAVVGVKDQFPCGSCWAFSAVGAIEGAHAIATGKLISLSDQQALDCSGAGSCSGGWMESVFKYVVSNGGICSQASYDYTGMKGVCQSVNCTSVANISGYVYVQSYNETALQVAVASRPVSIAVDASQPAFRYYSSGVVNDTTCGVTLDHAVLVAGYNAIASPPYWLVKNQWGHYWGERGYIRLAMGVPSANQCGMTSAMLYAVV